MLRRLLVAVGLASSPPPTTPPWPPATTCRSLPSEPAMVTGSHVLTAVKGHCCRTTGVSTGDPISSPVFTIGGCRWRILCYPDGRGSSNAGWVSVFLELDKSSAGDIDPHRVHCSFDLLDDEAKPVPLYFSVCDRVLWFTCMGATWGSCRFIRRAVLERSRYIRNDCFRVRCDVTIYMDEDDDGDGRRFICLMPPSNIRRHMEHLLEGGQGADVTFEVAGGETVAAHRCILAARSPVFMAALFGPMQEKTSSRMRIDDMEPVVFKALLHFVYTDSLPDEVDCDDEVAMAQHLLVAADRFGLDRLKVMSEDKLCRYINVNNVGTILALAEQHRCRGLKTMCFRYLMTPGGDHLKAAIRTAGFEHLEISCPHIVKELLATAAILI